MTKTQEKRFHEFVEGAFRILLPVCFCCLPGVIAGCSTAGHSTNHIEVNLHAQHGAKPVPMTPREVQAQVMRFADRLISRVNIASQDLSRSADTAKARAFAHRFKTEQATSAVMIAAGMNPTVNLLDMTVMVTLQRQSLEGYWVPEVYGAAAQSLLDTYLDLEKDIWAIARQVLKPKDQQELATLVREWRTNHADLRNTRMIPFEEFARAAGAHPIEDRAAPDSLFSLLFLNPFARLDRTRRAIEESEYLAERSMFYLQRMPELLQDHSQLMFFEVVESAPVQNAQSELERFVRTTEEFSETVKRLPTQVTEERTAAVQQLLQGLATQCTNVMTQLCSEEDKLQSSMRELRMTFTAGSEMASSVNAASRSLIAFTELVQPKQSSRTNRTNSHPFDIREYGETARDIGLSADQLTTLLRSLKESSPQFTELISHMQRESHSWVNYAIEKILLLTLCIVVLTFTASLWRRCLLDRSSTKHTRSSET